MNEPQFKAEPSGERRSQGDRRPASTLVVGIGSPHGDDQAGWHVIDNLTGGFLNPKSEYRKTSSPVDLLDWLDGRERLVVCDACQGSGSPGQLKRWEWPADQLLKASWSGTHQLSLPAVLQLAEQLGRLPAQVIIWSVEAADGKAMSSMSAPVTASIARISHLIAKESATA